LSVTRELLRSYARPRQVMRALMDGNRASDRPEARGFIYLLAGLLIIFLSQIPDLTGTGLAAPELSEQLTGEDGPAPLDARLAITLFVWLFVWPLILYVFGGLTHVLARLAGGTGQGVNARQALFWAILAISPLFLLRGMASVSQSAAMVMVMNYAIAAGFFWIWLSGLYEAEQGEGPDSA
jgi:hypothetical protein